MCVIEEKRRVGEVTVVTLYLTNPIPSKILTRVPAPTLMQLAFPLQYRGISAGTTIAFFLLPLLLHPPPPSRFEL